MTTPNEHFTFPTRNAAIHFDKDKDYSVDHRAADEDYNQFVLEDWLNRRLAVLPTGDSLWEEVGGELHPLTDPDSFQLTTTAGSVNLDANQDINLDAGADLGIDAAGTVIIDAGGNVTISGDTITLSGNLRSGQSEFPATGPVGNIVGRLPIYADTFGTLLGYIPIYDDIVF